MCSLAWVFEVSCYFGLYYLLVVVCGGFVASAVAEAFIFSSFVSVVVAPGVAFVVGGEACVACGAAQFVAGLCLCAAAAVLVAQGGGEAEGKQAEGQECECCHDGGDIVLSL